MTMTPQPGHRLDLSSLQQAAPGVWYTRNQLVTASYPVIAFLKDQASTTSLGRARLCAHPSPEAAQHDMIVATHHSSYVAPHRHAYKSETFLVLEGRADALIFDDEGRCRELIPIAPLDSGLTFFYRMPANQFHTLKILSDVLVFVESTTGPFDSTSSEYAPWAPPPHDKAAGLAFVAAAHAAVAGSRTPE